MKYSNIKRQDRQLVIQSRSMSTSNLLINVHEAVSLQKSFDKLENLHLVKGNYEYYHYICDGFDDRGWGCGYRTLQTICSWLKYNYENTLAVPSIKQIQQVLVHLEDKPISFLGSRQWIGSFEVCLIIDHLYNIPCKILHVNKGDELRYIVNTLVNHFNNFGSPVMMGGDVDCSSKGIMGIDVGGNEPSLLVVDPHYVGRNKSKDYLQSNGWVKWQPINDFLSSSFYNLCLPQAKAKIYL